MDLCRAATVGAGFPGIPTCNSVRDPRVRKDPAVRSARLTLRLRLIASGASLTDNAGRLFGASRSKLAVSIILPYGAAFNIPKRGTRRGIQRKYDSPVLRAEENHGIVMKPAPIMETDEGAAAAAAAAAAAEQSERRRRQAGRQARDGGRRERDQEQTKKKRKTKKKDLLQTQKPFAHGRGEEANAGRTARDGHRADEKKKRRRRR